MPPLLQSLFARYRRMTWGQRGYAVVVLVSLVLFGQAGINHWRARNYEAMHRRVAAAGAKSTRSVTVVDDTEEAYFMALLGDFSGVALTSVLGNGSECTVDTALLRDLHHYPEINSLRLSQVALQSVDFQQIYALENLTRLNLSFTDLTDASLAGIERLEALDSLELQYTPLTDASIPRLARLPHLSKIDLTGTDITPEGAEKLRTEYRLFQGAQSTTQVVHRQAPSPRFRHAVIQLLPTASYANDTRGGGFMRLQLRGEPWKGREQDIPLLAELTDVESVTITRMPLTPELIKALASLPKLRVLNISELPPSSENLSSLAACPNLRSIRFSSMSLEGPFLASLAKLQSLQTLGIFNCQLAPGSCSALAQVNQVQLLQLRQVDVPRPELLRLIAELQCFERLRLLDLVAVPIDNSTMADLARLTQLVSLGIGSNDIDDGAIPALSTFTHLQQLDISGTALSLPSLEIPASGSTQLEAALAPAGVRVVHPRSNTSAFPLNLSDLIKAKADAEAAAAKAKLGTVKSGAAKTN
jgi:Leucine-rich repeat (LRR) protein